MLCFKLPHKDKYLFCIYNYLSKIILPTHKKEQKTLLRLKFTAKNPQREHNMRLAQWRGYWLINIVTRIGFSGSLKVFRSNVRH